MLLNDMQPVLQIKGVQKTFENTTALCELNLELNRGEMLFLLGPSGCGKTTLLRCIAGFEQPDQGEIWLKGQLVFAENICIPTQQRHIGYVVQEGVLFPHLTVYRNIAYGLGNGKGNNESDRIRIMEVMTLVGISELAERLPHQLSGGQQQRVALARALAPKPELILLDEPFSALDEHLRQQIRQEMLQALRQSDTSAIFVTHDRDEALRYADRIAIIEKGEILQIADPRTIYWSPQHLSTAQFIGDSLILPATINSTGTQVDCELGRFPVQNPVEKHRTFSPNTVGKLLLRPEQFVFNPSNHKHTDLIARITEIAFKGRTTSIQLQLNHQQFSLETIHAQHYTVGDQIYLEFIGNGLFYEDEEQ